MILESLGFGGKKKKEEPQPRVDHLAQAAGMDQERYRGMKEAADAGILKARSDFTGEVSESAVPTIVEEVLRAFKDVSAYERTSLTDYVRGKIERP